MNKSQLIVHVAETTGLSIKQAERAINALIDVITKEMKSGESVSIPGFGTFMVRDRVARTGRNPKTGESIEIRASKVPVFKAGKLLKTAAGGTEETTLLSRDNIQTQIRRPYGSQIMMQGKMQGKMHLSATIEPPPNYALMNVFFATDRKQNEGADIKLRFGYERGELTYGAAKVSIPRDHKMGEIESRSIWKLEFRDNPEKHVMMLGITNLDKATYYETISKKIKKSKKKCAFIFVHGYNVTFEDAAKRTAQMSYDLGFDGAPVFYSWPSHGSTPKYPFDEENILWAQTNIEKFLIGFVNKSEAEHIYLIAHSMGNRALTRAYISVINKKPKLKSRFTEIILAAPDIDADVFKRDIAPAMLQAGNPITLYASSEDVPLKASKVFHGGHPRAGDSGENLIVLPGIESIDSTNVETGFMGHSYYADERSVISDMFYIFNENLRANERSGLREISIPNGVYWEFKK